jgi:hypothetical protein
MPATYEPIATTTLGSAASSISFTSINSSYTDLRLVFFCIPSTSFVGTQLSFNGAPSGSLHSFTQLYGNGSSASSQRTNGTDAIYVTDPYPNHTGVYMVTMDIFSYRASVNKTMLATAASDGNGSGYIETTAGLWRSTSAVTSLYLTATSGNFNTGTTATLYGILKA